VIVDKNLKSKELQKFSLNKPVYFLVEIIQVKIRKEL